jgi:hypothetical protein
VIDHGDHVHEARGKVRRANDMPGSVL